MRKKKGVILTEYLDEHFGAPFLSKGIAIGEMRGETRGIVIGEIRGKAEGKADTILNVLRARFGKVPKEIEKAIRAMTDSIALDSWAVQAATCASMKEFAEAVK